MSGISFSNNDLTSPKSTKSNTSLPLGKPDAPKVKAELFYAVRVESDGTVGLYEWDARTNKGWMRVWANKIEVKENA